MFLPVDQNGRKVWAFASYMCELVLVTPTLLFFSFLSHLKSEFPSIDGDRSMLRDKKNVSGRGYLPSQKPAQLHTRGIAPTRSCSKTRMQASKDIPTIRQIPRSGFSSTKTSETIRRRCSVNHGSSIWQKTGRTLESWLLGQRMLVTSDSGKSQDDPGHIVRRL